MLISVVHRPGTLSLSRTPRMMYTRVSSTKSGAPPTLVTRGSTKRSRSVLGVDQFISSLALMLGEQAVLRESR